MTLGFIVDTPGKHLGEPSPAALLDSLASVYERAPGSVYLALKVIGIYNKPDAPKPLRLFPNE